MEFYRPYHGITTPVDLKTAVEATTKAITEFVRPEDITHLVATGTSGQAVAWPVSMRLNVPVLVVRKPADEGHAGKFVGEGDLGDYVIIDDFIGSGATIRRIVQEIDAAWTERGHQSWSSQGRRPKPLAVFLYNSWAGSNTTFELPDGTRLPKFDLRGAL